MFSLPTGEGMRLYVQDRHTEEMAIFLWLADRRREHTHSPLQSQAVRLARQQCYIGRSTGIEFQLCPLEGKPGKGCARHTTTRTDFLRLDVTRVRKRSFWSSVANGAGFARRVRVGVWPRPRPIWSSASFPGSRRANGWCRYLSLYDIGRRRHRTCLNLHFHAIVLEGAYLDRTD